MSIVQQSRKADQLGSVAMEEKLRRENQKLREEVQVLQARLKQCTCEGTGSGNSNSDDGVEMSDSKPGQLLRRQSSFEVDMLGDVETIHCEVLTYLQCADLVSAGLVCHRWLVLSASAHVWKELLVRRFLHSSAMIEAMNLMDINKTLQNSWLDLTEESLSALSSTEQVTARVGLARHLRVSSMAGLPSFPQTRDGVSPQTTEHGVELNRLILSLKKPSRQSFLESWQSRSVFTAYFHFCFQGLEKFVPANHG